MLKGVFFQFEKDVLSLVATDGRRLAVAKKTMKTDESAQGEFILPSLTVSELEKLPKSGDKLSISFTDRQVAIELKVSNNEEEDQGFRNSVYLVSKVVEGKYPNYKQVIPKDDFKSATIEN